MDHHKHLVNHIQHPELVNDNTLHVVGVLTNPVRYHSRLRLFREWYQEMLNTPNVVVYVVECAYGDRQHEVADANNPNHLLLRNVQEIWIKENLINLAVKRLLPKNWRYLCWSDTDVFWLDKNWALEAIHQMQHHPVIQPWSDCMDMGFFGNVLQHFRSFCYQHRRGIPKQMHPSQPYEYAHTGYAWCCTRPFWEAIEELIDGAILGSADHHMAFSLINEGRFTVHKEASPNFKKMVSDWEYLAYRHCHGNVGFAKGTIMHKFHGPKNRGVGRGRQYRERWQIPIRHNFDPLVDLTYDAQGVRRLDGKPFLLQECHDYMVGRIEDSLEDY